MYTKTITNLLIIIVVAFSLSSCGGSSNGGSSNNSIVGYAVDDYLIGSDVTVTDISTSKIIQRTKTNEFGRFEITTDITSPVLVEISGGVEDFDGSSSTTNDQKSFAGTLKAIAKDNKNLVVSALTTGLSEYAGGDVSKYEKSLNSLPEDVKSSFLLTGIHTDNAIKNNLKSIVIVQRTLSVSSIVSDLKDDGFFNNASSASSASNVLNNLSMKGAISNVVDQNLQYCISDSIDKKPSDITNADILSITSLNCELKNINSLQGIEALKNLETLLIAKNEISSVKPLSSLSNIYYLDLSDNNMTSLSEFDTFVSSNIDLNINRNCIEDVSKIIDTTKIKITEHSKKKPRQYAGCQRNDSSLDGIKAIYTSTGLYLIHFRATNNPLAQCTINWADGVSESVPCDGRNHSIQHDFKEIPIKTTDFIINGKTVRSVTFPNQKPTDPLTPTCTPPSILRNGECVTPMPSISSIITDSSTQYVGESFNVTVNGEDLWQNMSLQITDGVCTRISTSLTLMSFACSTSYAGYKTIKAIWDGGVLREGGINIQTRTPPPPVVIPVVITLEYSPTVTYGESFDVTVKTDNPFMLAKIQWADGIESPVYALNGKPTTVARLGDIGTKRFNQLGKQDFTVRAYDESNNLQGSKTGSVMVSDIAPSATISRICVAPLNAGDYCNAVIIATPNIDTAKLTSPDGSVASIPMTSGGDQAHTFTSSTDMKISGSGSDTFKFDMYRNGAIVYTLSKTVTYTPSLSPADVRSFPSSVVQGDALTVQTGGANGNGIQWHIVVDNMPEVISPNVTISLGTLNYSVGTHQWSIVGYRNGVVATTPASGSFNVTAPLAPLSISSVSFSKSRMVVDSDSTTLTVITTTPVFNIKITIEKPDCSIYTDTTLQGTQLADRVTWKKDFQMRLAGVYRWKAEALDSNGTVISSANMKPVLEVVNSDAELSNPPSNVSFSLCDQLTMPISFNILGNPTDPKINESSRFSLSGSLGQATTTEWSVLDSASNVIKSVTTAVNGFFDYVFTQSGLYTIVATVKDAVGNILGQSMRGGILDGLQVPTPVTSNIFTSDGNGKSYYTNVPITFNIEGVTPQYVIWEVYDGSPTPSNLESSTRVNLNDAYTYSFTNAGEKTVVAKVYYNDFSPSNFYLYSTGTLSLSIRDDSEISPENNVLLGSTVTDSCSSNCPIDNGDLSNITDGKLETLGDIGSPNGGLIIYPKSAINLGRMILRSPVYINDDIDYEIFTSSSPVDSSLPPIWKTQGRQEMRTNISTPLDIIFISPETNVTQVKVLVYHGYPSAVEFSEIEGYSW